MNTDNAMTDLRDMMLDTAGRLFSDREDRALWQRLEDGEFPQADWQAITDMGFTRVLLAEAAGGTGLGVADGLSLAELAGYYALPLPLGETLVGNRLLASLNLPVDDGIMVLAGGSPSDEIRITPAEGGWRVDGRLHRVAWGRWADRVLLDVTAGETPYRLVLPGGRLEWYTDVNLADEPRDSATLDGLLIDAEAVATLDPAAPGIMHWGALLRSLQMAGAMRRALALAVTYAGERKQFGRPIAKFQAIQQQLAVMAGEVAAAGAAAQAGARALDAGRDADFMVAVGKARVGEAASRAAAIGHQVLGAMGFTREHSLQYFTRRLWSWRDEFGAEPDWQARIGRLTAAQGGDGLWPFLSER